MANQIVHPEGSYTIQQVGPSREWDFSGDGGAKVAMKTYSIQLEGIADWVDLNLKADGDAPTVGEVLEGHVEDAGKYGFKFQKKRKGGSWGGGKGYSAGAAWSAAYDTATNIVTGYFQVSGTKPKSIQEFLEKIDTIAPLVKQKVDALAGTTKTEEKDDTNSEAGESPADDKGVVVNDVDPQELGKW